MPDRDIPDQVSDAMEAIEEYTGRNVKKAAAETATGAYMEVVRATAIALPLVVGGQTAIAQQQELVKRPDEHTTSQTQHGPEIEIEEALVSGSPLDFRITAESGVYTIDGGQAQLISSTDVMTEDETPEAEA